MSSNIHFDPDATSMKHEDWEKQKLLEFISREHEDLDLALKWWWIKINWFDWEFEMLSFFQSMTVLWGNAANFPKSDPDVLMRPLSDALWCLSTIEVKNKWYLKIHEWNNEFLQDDFSCINRDPFLHHTINTSYQNVRDWLHYCNLCL